MWQKEKRKTEKRISAQKKDIKRPLILKNKEWSKNPKDNLKESTYIYIGS